MKPSARKIIEERIASTARLEKEAPTLRAGFGGMIAAYYAEGALTPREKELAAIACSVAAASVPSLANHIANAFQASATRAEIVEAAAIGVEFGGGPAYTVARDHLLDFMDEIEAGG